VRGHAVVRQVAAEALGQPAGLSAKALASAEASAKAGTLDEYAAAPYTASRATESRATVAPGS